MDEEIPNSEPPPYVGLHKGLVRLLLRSQPPKLLFSGDGVCCPPRSLRNVKDRLTGVESRKDGNDAERIISCWVVVRLLFTLIFCRALSIPMSSSPIIKGPTRFGDCRQISLRSGSWRFVFKMKRCVVHISQLQAPEEAMILTSISSQVLLINRRSTASAL